MWQMYALKAGMDFMGNLLKAGQKDIAAINDATQQQARNEDAWLNNGVENQAIGKANLQNTIRTAYRTGILNLQQGQARKREAELGVGLDRARLKAASANEANAAASGSIGASVEAVASDIKMQAEQADAGLVEDSRIQEQNYTNQLMDVLQAGEDALRSPTKINIRKVADPKQTSGTEVFISSIMGTAASYAESYMKQGFGGGAGGGGGMGGADGASMDGMGEGFEGMA